MMVVVAAAAAVIEVTVTKRENIVGAMYSIDWS